MKPKAVALLSGGLDSTVTLYYAIDKGFDCHCLIFDYGQRHRIEIARAGRIAKLAGARFSVVKLSLPWKGSSLVDKHRAIPLGRSFSRIGRGIPSTYVPARNTIFLSMAASCAEAIGAEAIFIGAHAEDSSGYPDCRRQYLEAFGRAVKLGTKAGIEGKLRIVFPLIDMHKKDIIRLGARLGAPLGLSWSCYKGLGKPCGECDSCRLRQRGFREAGIKDPGVDR